jgi:hypothetical protein
MQLSRTCFPFLSGSCSMQKCVILMPPSFRAPDCSLHRDVDHCRVHSEVRCTLHYLVIVPNLSACSFGNLQIFRCSLPWEYHRRAACCASCGIFLSLGLQCRRSCAGRGGGWFPIVIPTQCRQRREASLFDAKERCDCLMRRRLVLFILSHALS